MITFKEAITTCKRAPYLYLTRLSHSDDIFDKVLIAIGRTQIRKRIPLIIEVHIQFFLTVSLNGSVSL